MSTNYKMYLTFNNEKERLRIPELPEVIEITAGSKNESIDIVGLGEITIFQDRPALQIAFQSFFPAESSLPQQSIDTLLRWKEAKPKKPVHLIVTGTKINMFCSIENLIYSEKGGDVGTLYYSLTLKEYRDVKVKTITMIGTKAVTNGGVQRVDNRVQPKTYSVKRGDNLYNIAKAVCGNASKWKEIASINGIKTPYIIHPNQNLKLPG